MDGLGGEADAEFLEDFAVHLAGHNGGVHLAAVEEGKAAMSKPSGTNYPKTFRMYILCTLSLICLVPYVKQFILVAME